MVQAAIIETDGAASTVVDGKTHSVVTAVPSSLAVGRLSTDPITHNGESSLAAVSTDSNAEQQHTSESAPISSPPSNQDVAPPTVPSAHLSAVSASDDLDSFIRQLSSVLCKSDPEEAAVDILTEFDEVISQLDMPTEDRDSQKTLTPDDQRAADIAEEFTSSQMENDVASELNPGVTSAENMQGSDTKPNRGMPLASEADIGTDDVDEGAGRKTGLLSLLLYCKYEPPYLPTIGMLSRLLSYCNARLLVQCFFFSAHVIAAYLFPAH